MPPHYKLYYFNEKGAGEPIRMIFAYAKVPFEDIRYDWDKDWPSVKQNFESGALPVLEVDGLQLSESVAIMRFLAKKYGLAGQSEFEIAKIDEVSEAQTDFLNDIAANWCFFESDEEKKLANEKKLNEEIFAKYFTRFEKLISENPSGFVVGEKLSYADIRMLQLLDMMTSYFPTFDMGRYPLIQQYEKRIANQPGIKEWIEKRPKTFH